MVDDRLLIWCNGTADPVTTSVPSDPVPGWLVVLDSAGTIPAVALGDAEPSAVLAPGAECRLEAWSVLVLVSPAATS